MTIASPHPSTPTRPAKLPTESAKRKSTESGPSCIVCGNSSRANSVYCSDACILKHAQGVEKVGEFYFIMLPVKYVTMLDSVSE